MCIGVWIQFELPFIPHKPKSLRRDYPLSGLLETPKTHIHSGTVHHHTRRYQFNSHHSYHIHSTDSYYPTDTDLLCIAEINQCQTGFDKVLYSQDSLELGFPCKTTPGDYAWKPHPPRLTDRHWGFTLFIPCGVWKCAIHHVQGSYDLHVHGSALRWFLSLEILQLG